MRSRFVLALTLVLVSVPLLAGCSTPEETTTTTSTTTTTPAPHARLDPPTNLAFAAPAVLGTESLGAEPSIAVGPDGTAFVTTPLDLWKSTDAGATWTIMGTPSCPAPIPGCPMLQQYDPGMRGGGDSDIYVSPDGHVHWLGLADGANAIPYQVSTDNGTTWSAVQALEDGDDGGDREWITGRADGTLFAAWRNFPRTGDPMIVMRASYDNGTTWDPIRNVTKDTRQGGVAVDPTSPAIALASDLNGVITVSRSTDDGVTWQHVDAVKDAAQGHIFPVLAFDGNGTLYLAYAHDPDGSDVPAGTPVQNRPFETPSVFLAVSHDKGATWTAPVQVNKAGTTAWFPWIAAGAAGKIVITWYQNDQGLSRQAGGEVYVMAGISLDADFPAPRFAVTRVDPDPIHIGPECRENTAVCTRSLLDFFEVAIHPNGYPMLTYTKDVWPVPRGYVPTIEVRAAHMTSGPNLLQP